MRTKQEEIAVQLLKELIRINTINEQGEEYQAAEFIKEYLHKYAIETNILLSEKGRANFIAILKAENPVSKPLILLSHLDVVNPGENEWIYPPFSGKEMDGAIWGRGTLDTKQLTAMHILSLIKLSENRKNLNRDIYLIATADEENGSTEGMEFLVKDHQRLFEDAIVLSEGGGFTANVSNEEYMLFASGEKGNAIVELKTTGDTGHAGSPPINQAILKLAKVIQKITGAEASCYSYKVLDEFEEKLQAIIDKKQNNIDSTFLLKLYDYMKYETSVIFNLDIGTKVNIIPRQGLITIEFRTLPYTTRNEFEARLETILEDEDVEWDIKFFQPGYESNPQHEIIQLFEKFATKLGYKGEWVPFTALGKTDGRFIGEVSSDIFGISPLTIPFTEVLKRVHSVNERIEVDAYLFGVKLLENVLKEFCIVERGEKDV